MTVSEYSWCASKFLRNQLLRNHEIIPIVNNRTYLTRKPDSSWIMRDIINVQPSEFRRQLLLK